MSAHAINHTILPPFHLLTYSTLLGTQLFTSFVIVGIAHAVLPRPQFTTLQKRLFPVYFRTQSILVLLTILSYPHFAGSDEGASVAGLLRNPHDAVPLAITLAMALVNLLAFGPRAEKAMIERIHQETRDGRKYDDDAKSDEMVVCNRKFKRAHGMSVHVNVVAILCSVWYGIRLAGKLNVA